MVFWGFPKGHQEPGESIIETAKRELEEEVGVTVFKLTKPVAPIEVQYHFHSGGVRIQKSIYYFLAKLQSKTIKLQTAELEAYKWVYINELALFLGESYFDMITFLHQYFKLI